MLPRGLTHAQQHRNADLLVKTYLRTDIEALFQSAMTGTTMDYSQMQERKKRILAFKINIGTHRRRRNRFRLAQRVMGVRQTDLSHSATLKDFVENGPIKVRVIPQPTIDKIQRELWRVLYPSEFSRAQLAVSN